MERSLVALLALVPSILRAQNGSDSTSSPPSRGQLVRRDSATAYVYERPRLFHAVLDFPLALGSAGRESVRARHLPIIAGIAASTAMLIAADEQVLAETRRLGRRVDLPQNHPSANLRIGPFKQPFPTTIGSGLYFIGDGMTSVFLATGFAIRGTIADDNRARRTASEVIEALLASGTVTQVLKHAAGRQTPSEATVPRGRWRPFPKLSDYNANVPAYDAFPSGHLASTMATLTVVALNYPEHKFIWPVNAVAMSALSFAMVNNGVHWASDYPLALGIGAVIGKVVASRGRTLVRTPPAGSGVVAPSMRGLSRIELEPIVGPGSFGVRATW